MSNHNRHVSNAFSNTRAPASLPGALRCWVLLSHRAPQQYLAQWLYWLFLDHTSAKAMQKATQNRMRNIGARFKMFEVILFPQEYLSLWGIELKVTKPFLFFLMTQIALICGYMTLTHLTPWTLEDDVPFKVMVSVSVKQSNALWEMWLHLWAWPTEGMETSALPDAASCVPTGETHFIGSYIWLTTLLETTKLKWKIKEWLGRRRLKWFIEISQSSLKTSWPLLVLSRKAPY